MMASFPFTAIRIEAFNDLNSQELDRVLWSKFSTGGTVEVTLASPSLRELGIPGSVSVHCGILSYSPIPGLVGATVPAPMRFELVPLRTITRLTS